MALAALVTVCLLPVPAVTATGAEAGRRAAGYTTYVACSAKTSAKPATVCRASQPKAAFFRSARHDAVYKVCVKFPGRKKRLCASAQPADKGEKRIVTIATANTGTHEVRWYVDGKKVGSWNFQVTQG
jgi:hypothetical protein